MEKRSGRKGARSTRVTAGDSMMALAANPTTTKLNYETHRAQISPTTTTLIVARARAFAGSSSFLKMFLPLRRTVLDYRRTFKAAGKDGKPPTPDDNQKLKAWLDATSSVKFEDVPDPTDSSQTVGVEHNKTNREMLSDFISETLNEAILLDNAVAFWLDGTGYAFTVPMEKCEFADVLGVPILKYTHELTEEQKKLLPPDQQELFKRGTIAVDPNKGQHFKVFKLARTGDGFGQPGIFSIFTLLGEIANKEFGFDAMSFHMRNATRAHRLGYAIQQGDKAGRPHYFVWKKERHTAIMRDWHEIQGARDYSQQFDHEIYFPWPDLKLFDDTAWLGSNARLIQWAGPLGQMSIAKGVMPYLTPLLRAEVLDWRDKFRLFIEPVINLAYKPPVPIGLNWSNLIFNDARLQAELLKFAALQGWSSVQTQQEEAGFDPDLERERKLAEVGNPDARKIYPPMWDQSHGLSPALGDTLQPAGGEAEGQDADKTNGKPQGTQDKT